MHSSGLSDGGDFEMIFENLNQQPERHQRPNPQGAAVSLHLQTLNVNGGGAVTTSSYLGNNQM